MKQKNKNTPAKKKEHSEKSSFNLQQHHPAKKHSSKPQPENNIEPNESTLVDERDAPTINPDKVTRL